MPSRSRLRLQRRVLRAATQQQDPQRRMLGRDRRHGIEQQVEALVAIERTGEAEHDGTAQAQPLAQRLVGRGAEAKALDVDRIGDDGHLVGGNAARGDVAAQPLADGRDVIGEGHGARLEPARQAVAHAALARGAVIDGRILPRRTHLVDHRQAILPAHPDRRQRVQHRRMGMQDVRPHLLDHLGDPPAHGRHQPQFADSRQLRSSVGVERSAEEMPVVDRLLGDRRRTLLRRSEMEGLPAAPTLLAQQGERAKRVAAMQRQRMVEDVEDAQWHSTVFVLRTPALALGAAQVAHAGTDRANGPASEPIAVRRNASNISNVHRGEL